MTALLAIEDLAKRFGGVQATDGVSMRVDAGEIHALIGPNGAGKTSLINQISGAIKPDRGRILLRGVDITAQPVHARVARGLTRSYQITRLFRSLSALENIALAVQARSGSSLSFWRPVARERKLFDEARALLDELGLAARADTRADQLAHGEQRALEVGLALATRPALLLLDEPLAGTGPEESARMVELIEAVKHKTTVLLVEHDVDAVFRLADKVTVLVSGSVIASGAPAAVRNDPAVISAYLGDEKGGAMSASGSLLQVEGIETAYGSSQILFGIDFEIARGEVVGLLGRNGMGKTTLVRSLTGLSRPRAGKIRFDGVPIEAATADSIARLGMGLVPEGRQVFPNLTIAEHLTAFAANRNASTDPWTPAKVFALFPRLGERRDNLGNQLSGGEQQMLAIGRALVTNPKLLILDEATEGLAPLIREEIWSCLGRLRAAGQTILVIDKYVNRLVDLGDRHLIVERGRIAWRGTSDELAADRSLWARYLGA